MSLSLGDLAMNRVRYLLRDPEEDGDDSISDGMESLKYVDAVSSPNCFFQLEVEGVVLKWRYCRMQTAFGHFQNY